jgi:DNA-binding NtrC family response regulator
MYDSSDSPLRPISRPLSQPAATGLSLAVPKRVVVLDHDAWTGDLLARELAELGIEVALFTDCRDAMGIVSREAPDWIVVGLPMCQVSAGDFARDVRRVAPETRVILCGRAQAAQAGALADRGLVDAVWAEPPSAAMIRSMLKLA